MLFSSRPILITLYFACNCVKLCELSQVGSIKAARLFLRSLTVASLDWLRLMVAQLDNIKHNITVELRLGFCFENDKYYV